MYTIIYNIYYIHYSIYYIVYIIYYIFSFKLYIRIKSDLSHHYSNIVFYLSIYLPLPMSFILSYVIVFMFSILSSQRTPSSISYEANLVITNSLNLCLSGKVFTSSSFMKDSFAIILIFGRSFNLSVFSMSFHALLTCKVSAAKIY